MDPQSSPNFMFAGRAILNYLHQRIGFGLWMITETTDKDWTILLVENKDYPVSEGMVLNWSDSICYQMMKGLGPNLACNVSDFPQYSAAPICSNLTINAYIGVPIYDKNGTLFGTLCAIDKNPQTHIQSDEVVMLELFAKLLGTFLNCDNQFVQQTKTLEHLEHYAHVDQLSGLLNRNGWEHAISEEEARLQRYGGEISLLFIDIDNLKSINDTHGHAEGDKAIKHLADLLKRRLRSSDLVARVGGDEFSILARDCTLSNAQVLREKLYKDFSTSTVKASIGVATLQSSGSILDTLRAADADMYANKLERKL